MPDTSDIVSSEDIARRRCLVEYRFRRHRQLTKWQKLKLWVYNPDMKEYFGRNRESWIRLLIFYGIIYGILACMFAICMQGLFATLDDHKPKWTLAESLIGTNPGMGFRPISDKLEEGSLIWYSMNDKKSINKWVSLLDTFLESYADQSAENFINCDFYNYPRGNQVCRVHPKVFGKCNKANSPDYGYSEGSPCVFVKLNRIYDWQPKFFRKPNIGMPSELKAAIKRKQMISRSQIWVTCNGERSYDKENAKKFSYYPHGFPGYYYPYENKKNYLSPLVAVKIINPVQNVLITIECRAWAENIRYVGGDLKREGSVRFEIMIDNPNGTKTKQTNVSARVLSNFIGDPRKRKPKDVPEKSTDDGNMEQLINSPEEFNSTNHSNVEISYDSLDSYKVELPATTPPVAGSLG